ncbi:MAG: cytochrome-c peroxidase, partial [Bacteroidetes bacterium]|nr:cytochrome-c peroxidase [Bacteroidota bacterium]
MTGYNKVFAPLVVLCLLLLLANCKHDPPVGLGSPADPDSLYIGRPYSFIDNSAGPTAEYRKVKVPADNPETYEGIQLGRMLFYDSTLSLNGHVSCGTCHKQQYSFGDNQKLSQNVHGSTTRNASALMNLGVNSIFFWDGRQATIEDAVNDAFTHEQSPDINTAVRYLDTAGNYRYLFKKAFGRPKGSDSIIDQVKIVKAIAQFIRTLRSENSRYDAYARGDAGAYLSASELSGKEIFFNQQEGDCAHCHVDAPYLTFAFQAVPMRNNALDTVSDVYQFPDIGYGKV